MFELKPERPAIVEGTTTFQLLLWQGCVRAGNRVKVHVEAASGGGGEQVRAARCERATAVVSMEVIFCGVLLTL